MVGLLNQLLGQDRAIVSPLAGTTRDTIEETANIRGLPIVFVDTAGLRETADQLEAEGIRRTRAAAGQAEILLHVLDRSEPLDAVDRGYLAEFAGRPRVLVLNKADLPDRLGTDLASALAPSNPPALIEVVPVSCTTGAGIAELGDALFRLVQSGRVIAGTEDIAINARHEDALRRGRESVERAAQALADDLSLELVALDLRVAIGAIGEVVGETTTDDLLDVIFREFCLGK